MSKIKSTLNDDTPTATKQIYEFVGEYLARSKDTHVNRASSATMCYLRRWFQRNGFEGEVLEPRKIVNFLLGDLTERVVQYFILEGLVGPGKLYSEVTFGEKLGTIHFQGKPLHIYKQEDLIARVGDIDVTAHVDGWGKRNSDGEWELIEIKSSNDIGFGRFVKLGPENYLKQAHVNMTTNKALELGVKCVRFFFLKKNTGHLWDKLYNFDPELMRDVVEEYKLADQEEKPIKPFFPFEDIMVNLDPTKRGHAKSNPKVPSGRKKLAFPCSYCPYKNECYPSTAVEFTNNGDGTYTPANVVKE